MPEKADQACSSCKKLKRKCDKTLPSCSLCGRVHRLCEYADPPSTPTRADYIALQTRVAQLEERSVVTPETSIGQFGPASPRHYLDPSASVQAQSTQYTFPSALFLDFDCYRWAGLRLPKPNIEVPAGVVVPNTGVSQDVVSMLNHGLSIVDTASKYFNTIHRWFPVTSEKRFMLGITIGQSGSDLAMLMLAMKLIVGCSDEKVPADSSIYTTSKRYLSLLEASGTLSLQTMQAMLLIALYEYSHAIYPAAWMSVGACVRYAELLGIVSGKEAHKVLGQCTTWTEAEERKRVWWGVYILDRAITLGGKRRPGLGDPTGNDSLPVNDQAWDAGDVAQAIQVPVSIHFSAPQSRFARLCQSALLISKASMYNGVRENTDTLRLQEISHLTSDMLEFAGTVRKEYSSGSDRDRPATLAAYCLVRSAIFMLLDTYCCPESIGDIAGYIPTSPSVKSPEETMVQLQAITTVRIISDEIGQLCVDISRSLSSQHSSFPSPCLVSPLSFDAVYCTLATFNWIWSEGGSDEVLDRVKSVRRYFEIVGERWALGREYLKIADYHTRLWQ